MKSFLLLLDLLFRCLVLVNHCNLCNISVKPNTIHTIRVDYTHLIKYSCASRKGNATIAILGN